MKRGMRRELEEDMVAFAPLCEMLFQDLLLLLDEWMGSTPSSFLQISSSLLYVTS